jgi:S-adenosyl methyltransferase
VRENGVERRESSWATDVAPNWKPPVVDTSVPHPHRVYDYLIGGKENYQIDRDAGEELLLQVPDLVLTMRAMEAFIPRSISWLAAQGITQFLQLGNAIVTPYNNDQAVSHEIAQAAGPDVRFVYAAEDPITVSRTRAAIAGQMDADVTVLLADFREPERILRHLAVIEKIDLSRPVGILLICMLDFIADPAQAERALDTLYDWAPSGSRIALFQMLDWETIDWGKLSIPVIQGSMAAQMTLRTPQQLRELLARYMDKFEPPGLVPAPVWRPDGSGPGPELGDRSALLAGVIAKP